MREGRIRTDRELMGRKQPREDLRAENPMEKSKSKCIKHKELSVFGDQRASRGLG